MRTAARNRIAPILHRVPTTQQAKAFARSDQLGRAMPDAVVDLAADRIELAVEA